MQAEKGLNFPDRKITVSTCGITPEIVKFTEVSNVNLAISLHSVDEKVRTELMPINLKYPLDDLLDFCRRFSAEKESPILIEYILFRDINDSECDAHDLAEALHGINCKVNLLCYNEHPNLEFRQSTEGASLKFKDVLHNAGYRVMMRRSRGSDISAACGQLAGKNSL
jgi:23S rRNA (adenine2503-C2)-methyltransferase